MEKKNNSKKNTKENKTIAETKKKKEVKEVKNVGASKAVKKETVKTSETKENSKPKTTRKPRVKAVAKVEVETPKETIPEINILTPHKKEFLEVLEQMFLSDKPIGHLLFNGIFRLAMNKRLYEFSDEEVLKAFNTQLNIMKRKQERAISEEVKIKRCRDLI
ncbi:MAG: hypothetical protein J6J36_00750 [Clostridia bacterium]|nr:hypothetical protein [Clostridia bacterium]